MSHRDRQSNKQTPFERALETVRQKNDRQTAEKQADFLVRQAAERISFGWIVLLIVVIALVIAAIKLTPFVLEPDSTPTTTAGSVTPPPLVEVHFTQEGPIVIENSDQTSARLEFEVLEDQQPPQETRNVVFCLLVGSVGNCSESKAVPTNAAGIAVYEFSLPLENGDVTVRGELAEDPTFFDTIQIQIRRKSPNLTFTDVSVDPDPASVNLKQGDSFSIVFDIQNTGEADAANVRLRVQIPAGIEYIGEECDATDDGSVLCEVGNLTINNNSPNRVSVKLQATAPGMVMLQPEMYSVSYGGNANAVITGSQPVALIFGELQPFRIELQAAEERILADGQTSVRLSATVYDEKSNPINRTVDVTFSLSIISTTIQVNSDVLMLTHTITDTSKGSLENTTAKTADGIAINSYIAGSGFGTVAITASIETPTGTTSDQVQISLFRQGKSNRAIHLAPERTIESAVIISSIPANTVLYVWGQSADRDNVQYYWSQLEVWMPREAISLDENGQTVFSDESAGYTVILAADTPVVPIGTAEKKDVNFGNPLQINSRNGTTGQVIDILEDDGESSWLRVLVSGWVPVNDIKLIP